MFRFFQSLGPRLRENASIKETESTTLSGKQGADGELPPMTVHLSKPDTSLVGTHSGPEGGVSNYKNCAQDLQVPWNTPTDYAYGKSISLYDTAPTSGRRNGEPIADCFGILAYPDGAILAVADGVNWGEPPRRAARCAVLGSIHHVHKSLKLHEKDSELTSDAVFRHMVQSLTHAQKLILQQFGTLTTLVLSVVLPTKWQRSPRKWAAMTLTVGDSAAYVYRCRTHSVEEVTAATHAESIRDPRWCPGALGYAMGEDPDLSNMMLCLTFLEEGDYIFLASDGVADNFDPVIRKLARHQVLAAQMEGPEPELPALTPIQVQEMAMKLLNEMMKGAQTAHTGPGQLTGQGLVEYLLNYVYEVTEEHRQHVEQRNRDREKGLQTLTSERTFMSSLIHRQPGKMDHATVACYQVGRRKAPKQDTSAVSPPSTTGQVPPAPINAAGASTSTGGGGSSSTTPAATSPRTQAAQ